MTDRKEVIRNRLTSGGMDAGAAETAAGILSQTSGEISQPAKDFVAQSKLQAERSKVWGAR